MPAAPVATPSSPGKRSSPIQQLYITHCLYDEGIARQAGFGVRACSTRDPLLLRFAQEYPTYELPVGAAADLVSPAQAPRRLALVRIPGGKSALIHSVYLPAEGVGRANNFFSHVLILPALEAREALATWGADEWVTSLDPQTGKDLEARDRLPQGGRINDQALTAFLQPGPCSSEDDLATLVCPERLANDPEGRRRLLRLTLRGCLQVLQPGSAAARRRFFILAEPGLTALLLYAVTRLLPSALAGQLTFSTYENAHRDLRTFRHTQVVGTYLTDPTRGLDDDFFTSRGYALDTFSGKTSAEIQQAEPLPVDDWIEMVARGEWDTINHVYGLLGKTATSLVSFREGLEGARFSHRLANGSVQPLDLLALKKAPWGAALIARYQDTIWPLIRDASLTEPQLRQEFAGMLREHLPELEQRAAVALRTEPVARWQPHWRLLWLLLQDDLPRLRDSLQRILPEPPYPPALRLGLLHELREQRVSPMDPRLPLQQLLRTCGAEDLEQLARSDLPREWLIWGICHAVFKLESRPEAIRLLHEADDELLRIFWEQLDILKDERQRRAILGPLFPPFDVKGSLLLSRLLKGHGRVRTETLEWLLDWLGVFQQDEWAAFWKRENHLGHLLDMLRERGEEAGKLWERIFQQIRPEALLPGAPWQEQQLLLHLIEAAGRSGPPLLPWVAQAISDWGVLREHFERASPVAPEVQERVQLACQRLGIKALDLLALYFARFVRPHGQNEAVLQDFIGFFLTFYAPGRDYADHASRLLGWLRIVEKSDSEELHAYYQQYYLEHFVPEEHRLRLLEEKQREGTLLPDVVLPTEAPASQPTEGTAAPPAEGVAPSSPADLFSLAGLPAEEMSGTLSLRALGKRLGWLLCAAAAGLAAAALVGAFRLPPQRAMMLILFLPAPLILADATALQCLALALTFQRRRLSDPNASPPALGRQLLVAILLGLICGGVVCGIALACTWPWRLALSFGLSTTGAMAAAAVVGLTLPALFLRFPRAGLPTGPLTRALVAILAVGMYFGVAGALVSDSDLSPDRKPPAQRAPRTGR